MNPGSGADTAPEGDITLAFDLEALDQFADPAAVVADAREWSRYVGVVGDDPEAVDAYVNRRDIQQDYHLATAERYAILSKLKWEADTDRYVIVGSREKDRKLAEYVGWEYLPVREAAEKADWTLAAEVGVVDRVRASLSRFWP